MKTLCTLFILAIMTVSCGNKNKSGGENGADTSYSNLNVQMLTFDQENTFLQHFRDVARELLNQNKTNIVNRYDQSTFDSVYNKVATMEVRLSYDLLVDNFGQSVDSGLMGDEIALYVGVERSELSWRYLIDHRTEAINQQILNMLLSSENVDGYSYRRFKNYKRTRRNGHGGSWFQWDISFNNNN
jgi:hypothetical protein